MQPKWITYRKPKASEAGIVADVRRRYGKKEPVRVAVSDLYKPRPLPPPSPEIMQLVADDLTANAILELPTVAHDMVTMTLNKLDRLPPLRAKASDEERHARKQVPLLVDLLAADLASVKEAHANGDYKRMAWAWGFACNIIGRLEGMFDLEQMYRGRKNIESTSKGGRSKVPSMEKEKIARGEQTLAERDAKIVTDYQDQRRRHIPHNQALNSIHSKCKLTTRHLWRIIKPRI